MIITESKEQSDWLCIERTSHVLVEGNKETFFLVDGNRITAISDERNVLLRKLYKEPISTIRTKTFGTLMYFERLERFLGSRYNRGIMAFVCGSTGVKRGKNVRKTVILDGFNNSLEFIDKEYVNGGGLALNEIDNIEEGKAYLVVLSKNINTENGCQIIFSNEIKKQQPCKKEEE